jgi:hypothetical protein
MNITFGSSRMAAVVALIAVWTLTAFSQPPRLIIERILTPAVAQQQHLGILRPDIAFTPNGVAVVGDGDKLWAVGADGALRIAGVRNANSFAIAPQGLLVVISGKSLLYLDPFSRTLKPIFDLPFPGMSIVSENQDSFFLFGPDGAKGFALYELLPGRKVVKVVDTPRPITGVTRLADDVLIVSGGALFAVYQNSLRLLAGEIGGKLRSVAADSTARQIFVSDDKSIFAIHQDKVVPLVGDLGGELRWQSGGLLVFNPTQRSVARLVNLTETEAAP